MILLFSCYRNGPDPDNEDEPFDYDNSYVNAYLEHHDPCDYDRNQARPGQAIGKDDEDEDLSNLMFGKSKIF